ncbi:hypothetical protein ZIOFF_022046 [Zingiber officinale]|uniref:Uncharacterized protein n=1 Tax=Zingiber officinale TaxID=94328 RepID=A0A8J5L8Z6_ZINOF|nr:hypothetical protein ZIOFF_022046 [Zingiber officinale]
MRYRRSNKFELYGFSDSYWVGSVNGMNSTSGYCFSVGSACFSWCSKKQKIVTQSTAEVEFVAATSAVNQTIWLRKLLNDMGHIMEKETKVSVDNQAALAISKNPVFHEDQLADIFTKSFHQSRFVWFREKIGKVALQKLASVEGSVVLCFASVVVSDIDAGDSFPSLHGQLDVNGLSFHILDSPSACSELTTTLCFRGERIFLPNASGWFGDAPLEASSDFGINPENGEFHLMCQNCGAVGNRLDKRGERYAICRKEDNRGDPATARDVRINPNPTARDYGAVLSSAMLAAAVEERQRRGAAAEAAEIGAREDRETMDYKRRMPLIAGGVGSLHSKATGKVKFQELLKPKKPWLKLHLGAREIVLQGYKVDSDISTSSGGVAIMSGCLRNNLSHASLDPLEDELCHADMALSMSWTEHGSV